MYFNKGSFGVATRTQGTGQMFIDKIHLSYLQTQEVPSANLLRRLNKFLRPQPTRMRRAKPRARKIVQTKPDVYLKRRSVSRNDKTPDKNPSGCRRNIGRPQRETLLITLLSDVVTLNVLELALLVCELCVGK